MKSRKVSRRLATALVVGGLIFNPLNYGIEISKFWPFSKKNNSSQEDTIDDVALNYPGKLSSGWTIPDSPRELHKFSKRYGETVFGLFKTPIEPQVIRNIGNSDKNLPTKVLTVLKRYPDISRLELKIVAKILNKEPEIGIKTPLGDYSNIANLLPGEIFPFEHFRFEDPDSRIVNARIKSIRTADGRKLSIDGFIEGPNKLNSQGNGLEGSISFDRPGIYLAKIEVGDGMGASIVEIKFNVEPRDFLSQRDHLFNRIAKQLNYGSRNGNLKPKSISSRANDGTPLEDMVCNRLELTDYRVRPDLSEMIWNQVERNINALLGKPKYRKSLVKTFERASEYADIIQRASCISGLSQSFIYGWLATESAANSRGNSRANAKGLAMFIGTTARERGLVINYFIDQRYDPEVAIIEGAKLIAEHISRYGLTMGVAAYNAGPGLAGRILRKHKGKIGIDAFYELPAETESYFPRFLSRTLIYQHRDVLGLNIGQRPLYTRIKANSIPHKVQPGETVSGIAVQYGWSERVLVRINPLNSPHRIRAGDIMLVPDPEIYTKPLNSSLFFGR